MTKKKSKIGFKADDDDSSDSFSAEQLTEDVC